MGIDPQETTGVRGGETMQQSIYSFRGANIDNILNFTQNITMRSCLSFGTELPFYKDNRFCQQFDKP